MVISHVEGQVGCNFEMLRLDSNTSLTFRQESSYLRGKFIHYASESHSDIEPSGSFVLGIIGVGDG